MKHPRRRSDLQHRLQKWWGHSGPYLVNKVVEKHSVGNVSDNEPVHAEISFPEKSNDDCNDHNETGQMRTDRIGSILTSHLCFCWGKSTWYGLIHASSSSEPKIKIFHRTRSYVPSRMYGSIHGYSRCRPRLKFCHGICRHMSSPTYG